MRDEQKAQKIRKLLGSRKLDDMQAGLDLLRHTPEADLISHFLNDKSFISSLIRFQLIPVFQEHPQIWEKVRSQIPDPIIKDLDGWMPYTLFETGILAQYEFCDLCSEKMKAIEANFPELSTDILEEPHFGGYYYYADGKQIENGTGWELKITSEDFGPAEVIREEDWLAIAHFEGRRIKFAYNYVSGSFPRCWQVELTD